jgi:hypothetical protein
MRLLHRETDGAFGFSQYYVDDIPSYAILSHTWGADEEEVTFLDIQNNTAQAKVGFRKLEFCANQARSEGYTYVWVDSCCIDKSNNAELSEALNSMFRWYREAQKCYVYLADVYQESPKAVDAQRQPAWEAAFRGSRWFTRGWTLQELIAPSTVQFYSAEWYPLGDKESLEQQIHEITQIPVQALRGSPLSNFPTDELMSWSSGRQTKRGEDMAYCLLGMLNVYLPPIYGEGKDHALLRLQEEVAKRRGRTDYNNPKERSPNPSVVLPFVRDADFVERGALLDKIDQKCANPGSRTALVGLGGIGYVLTGNRQPYC